jgi:CheY-like chemotaxis protein
MDINMPPGIDGSEACRRIRKSWAKELKDTMIFAYTAIPKEQFGNPYEKKFDGILNKPCTPTDLKEVLKKASLI